MTAAVVLTTSCSKDDETDKEPKIGPNPMTMTTTLSNVSIYMTVKGTVNIDWGDKTEIESHTFQSESSLFFTHSYSISSDHNIAIAGGNITYLACHENLLTQLDVSRNTALSALVCFRNQLTSLDLSRNTRLGFLDCTNNKLTSLDMSRQSSLWHLECNENALTSEALNTMLGTLHHYVLRSTKEVYIGNNPGTDDCDISIAEDKGWVVIK